MTEHRLEKLMLIFCESGILVYTDEVLKHLLRIFQTQSNFYYKNIYFKLNIDFYGIILN